MVFRLNYLKVENHPIISDLKFLGSRENTNDVNKKQTLTTLIIGPNGTGKSKILQLLIHLFRELNYLQRGVKEKYSPSYRYELSYNLKDDHYIIKSGKKGEKEFLKNNKHIEINSLKLPLKVIASTALLNDKFIFPDNALDNDGFYNYLGLRKSTNSASTATYLKNVVEGLIQLCDNKKNLELIKESLEFLKLKHIISIEFHPKYRSYFFNKELTLENFRNFFDDWKNTTKRQNAPRSLSYLNKLSDAVITELITAIERLKSRIDIYAKSRTRYINYEIDLDNIESHYQIIQDFGSINKLMKLDILSRPYLLLYKRDSEFEFEEASSGEFHFLSTIIRILSVIDNYSLILIDEPENSLHPNWQMKFVNHLKEIFSDYYSCHFIISTHSHFMVSDLNSESSSIISLKFPEEGKKIETILHDENTYGWSTEDILYNIFEMRTTRNYFVGMDIKNLLELISKQSNDYTKIKMLIEKLKKLSLKDEDPLKIVINQAEEYLPK